MALCTQLQEHLCERWLRLELLSLEEIRERYRHSVVFNINALPFVLYRGC